jgi:DNA-binding NarL/FixJ family response regulator
MDHVDRTYDILLLDDNAVDRMTVRRQLTKSALLHSLADSASIHELNASLAVRSYDCLLVDDSILGSDGRELLLGLREAHPDLAIITLAEVDDRESAVRLIKLGASEILVKSWATPALLSQSIRSSVRNARTERAARVAEDARDRSERRFRSLAEAIPLMVWTANAALWLRFCAGEHARWRPRRLSPPRCRRRAALLGWRAGRTRRIRIPAPTALQGHPVLSLADDPCGTTSG